MKLFKKKNYQIGKKNLIMLIGQNFMINGIIVKNVKVDHMADVFVIIESKISNYERFKI